MSAARKVVQKSPKKPLAFPAHNQGKTAAALSRRTITIRPDTEKAIDALVGPRKFSAFVQTALDRQLQRERIDQWLVEQETTHGPLSAEDVAFAENAWRSRR
jgi:post-segregation antitoxin (ccd killing protein)